MKFDSLSAVESEASTTQRLHEIIERKLHCRELDLPVEVLPDLNKKEDISTRSDKEGVTILRKGKSTEDKRRIIEESEKVHKKVEEKTQNIYSLAEQLLNGYQTGVEPDEEYLEDISDLAIDYYRKDWHELVDTYHQETKRQRWETEKEGKMREIISKLYRRVKK